jgi:hypothetical protein
MSTKEMLKVPQLENLDSKIYNLNNNELKIQKEKEEKKENNKYDYGLNKIKNKYEKYEKWYNENYSK